MPEIERSKNRHEAYLEINKALLTMEFLTAEDVPDLVELIVSRAGQNIQSFNPTHCGMCQRGMLVPICSGNARRNPCTPNERLVPVLVRRCNNCSFIYEDNPGRL